MKRRTMLLLVGLLSTTHSFVYAHSNVDTMMLKTGDNVKVSGGGTQVWSSASGKWKLVSVSASDKPLVNQ